MLEMTSFSLHFYFIISHILTAAHCINFGLEEYVEKTVVRYGSIRIDEGMKEVKLGKLPYYNDTHYISSALGYDLALFFLEDDLELDVNASPICIYHGNVDLEIESRSSIVGFGKLTGIRENFFGSSIGHL